MKDKENERSRQLSASTMKAMLNSLQTATQWEAEL